MGIECDNSKNNLVNLKYSDHVLAHYYLYHCTITPLKEANNSSFFLMTNTSPDSFNINDFTEQYHIEYDKMYKEYCLIKSAQMQGKNNPMYGKRGPETGMYDIHRYGLDNPMYGKHHTKESIKKMQRAYEKKPHPASKSVLCIETGKIYRSITYASKQTGINKTGICDCVNGKQKTAGGFHWEAINTRS